MIKRCRSITEFLRRHAFAFVVPALLLALGAWAGVVPTAKKTVRVPAVDIGADSLVARKVAQEKTIQDFKVFHDFRFSDKQPESGITFVHQITDDSGKFYKPNHYDHGNGIAVADVDGDGLYDIYFLSQLGGNQLWKNLGNGKFQDITESAGVALKDRISVTASFADIDNDGDPDLYVTTVRGGNVLFENDGKGHFKDISKGSSLDYVGHSSGAVFFDYNKDGLLDLYLVNVGVYTTEERGRGGYFVGFADAFSGHLKAERTEKSRLYKNVGHNHFVDVTEQVGMPYGGWSGDASFTDFDGDGFPDLYVLNMQGDDHYFENQKGERFVDKTEEHFPKTPWGSMGIKFFDYDNDGKMDLVITDMHSDMSEDVSPEREKLKSRMQWTDAFLQGGANNIFGNAFYRNLGGGKFEEISDKIGVENYWPWGVSVGDFNADGWDDIFVTASMCFPFRYGINSLLLNNRGERFLDAEFLLGIEPRRGGKTAIPWFDVDCATEGAGRPVCRGESGPITVAGTLGTRSSAVFDIDNDGDLDIVTNEFGSAPQVLISNLAERRPIHYLKVRLVGTVSNRDGLGATVRVSAGNRVYVKYHDGKSGYLSQSSLPLYFGLGDAKSVQRIEVLWPSGKKSLLEKGTAINKTVEITEPR
jgi:enediyne biosynthesis protein E4